jgi:hypothetical protein
MYQSIWILSGAQLHLDLACSDNGNTPYSYGTLQLIMSTPRL